MTATSGGPGSPRYLGRRHALVQAGGRIELRDRLSPDAPPATFPATERGWAEALAELARRDGTVFDTRSGAVVAGPGTRSNRRRRRVAVAAAVAVAVAAALSVRSLGRTGGGEGPATQPGPLSQAEVIERVSRSTVLIVVSTDRPVAVGSGWLYDAARGLVVTNDHVVDGGTSYRAGVPGSLAVASLVAEAPCEDLAVLRLSAVVDLEAIELAPDGPVQVGEAVMAFGFPPVMPVNVLATQLRYSAGEVTHPHVDVDAGGLTDLIQHSARLAPGSSGGPLVDMRGRLIGVNVGIDVEDERFGYAIRGQRVRRLLPALLAGTDVCAA
jgi:S1-C subfamily serine protease